MPELPEVEVVRLQLSEQLLVSEKKSVTLESVQFHRPDLRFVIPQRPIKKMVGEVLQSLDRHGKYLIFNFGTRKIVSHFGMTGTWRFLQPDEKQRLHDHVIFNFVEKGCRKSIVYHDPRRFGFLDYADDFTASEFLERLGPDALECEQHQTELLQEAQKREIAIKNLLLDQGFMAGVGNIYANEALFLAGIHPAIPARRVSEKKMEKLCLEIPKLLQTSIRLGGSSIDDFHGADEKPGNYQNEFWVYDREGEKCRVCGSVIRSLKLGQRSTYSCVRCQK